MSIDTVREALEMASKFFKSFMDSPRERQINEALAAISTIEADRDAWKAKAEYKKPATAEGYTMMVKRHIAEIEDWSARAALQEDTPSIDKNE